MEAPERRHPQGRNRTPLRVESQKGSAVSNTNPVQQVGIVTATFGEIVALLSVLPVYKHMSLAELKWFR
ncbi:MAG: hypothetical protein H6749_00155 [Nitrospiraceae bacterium]|nr:hypothetical protein [Nitrospiraceae bacterium]